jgi:hypothetical protein
VYEEVIKQLDKNRDQNIAVICASGIRKHMCAQSLSTLTRVSCYKCLRLRAESSIIGRTNLVLLLKIIESSSLYPSYLSHLSGKDVETLFTLWLSLLKMQDLKYISSAEVSLRLQLEKILASILWRPENHGRISATILKCICEYGVGEFLELLRKDLVNTNTERLSDLRRTQIPFHQGMLHSLIAYDVSVLAQISLVLLLSEGDKSEALPHQNELLVVILHNVLEYNQLATEDKQITVERTAVDRLCIIVKTMVRLTL